MPTSNDITAIEFAYMIERIDRVYIPKREAWITEWIVRLYNAKVNKLPTEHLKFIHSEISNVRKQIRYWQRIRTNDLMFLQRVDRERKADRVFKQ